MKLNRAPKWDRHRAIFLKLGFIGALALTFMAFNYTSYHSPDIVIIDSGPAPEILEVTPPIMRDKKPIPPPPAPEIVIDPIVEPVEQPDFIEEPIIKDVTKPTSEVTSGVSREQPAPPPAPKIEVVEKVDEDEVKIIAERMPAYGDCKLAESEQQRRKCTQDAMLQHIYGKLKYRQIARENRIEGTVVISFVVDKSVLSVIKSLEDFQPARQNGRLVSVMYRVPVKFKLED